MLFNSFVFVWFFLIVYTAYLLLQGRLKWQNFMLMAASFVFYGYWDWRFLILMVISSSVDYTAGLALGRVRQPAARKLILFGSMSVNLVILGFFKYWNFFAASAHRALALFGLQADFVTLNVVLPVGISFYTFQSMSYTIDVYRNDLRPVKSPVDYFLYVTYFTQLVAGPIERGTNLVAQVLNPRKITADQVHAGLFLLLLGYFKKVVVADNIGLIANRVFSDLTAFQGLDLVLGTLAFAVQIYGDFSGYSDIARGMAKLMGFELMVNFRNPFFALNPADFWGRWHISLSTWLRDYLYIPLGGNRRGPRRTYVNLLLTMFLGGLWHGAAWHFVLWGVYHGLLLVLYRWLDRDPQDMDLFSGHRSRRYVLAKMGVMSVLTHIGWVLFRVGSVSEAAYLLTHAGPQASPSTLELAYGFLFFTTPLFIIEWWQYAKRDLLAPVNLPMAWRASVYAAVIAWMCIFGVRNSLEFIYFQF